MNETTWRPLTTGSRGTRELLFSPDQEIDGFLRRKLVFEVELRCLFDVGEELVEGVALGVDTVIHSGGAPDAVFIAKNLDLDKHWETLYSAKIRDQ